ncbi:hypothetical protein [Bradyrhizobium sp. SZCCHNRI1073]|uniref:hypothetical protein n=1 Tax=Bradyrhizobium sp. SZCCHNRI1073 TaxID=3057280 RepID=UPI002916712B|nr:hypothetical protein [Bradyrhizobium sp. SZCCHNRI1073]
MSDKDSSFRIPRDRLPESPELQHGLLRDYFCDKDARCQIVGDSWDISLYWPDDPERHVDPRLTEGLRWWEAGLRLEEMGTSQRRDGHVLRSLYDTWTLLSWSEWLQRNGERAKEGLVVLHVDDHRDLGRPRLFARGSRLYDPITGFEVDFGKPETIDHAIRSGAIGMGSFFTVFLHAMPNVDVRHLCQPPKALGTKDFEIQRTFVPDTLIDPSEVCPAIQLVPLEGKTLKRSYRLTSSLDEWLDGLERRPILVHIDLDYFNNRYDGDSDWCQRATRLDPPASDVCRHIDEIGERLQDSRIEESIADVVVSFSPGFFPAEFWEMADERLSRYLEASL